MFEGAEDSRVAWERDNAITGPGGTSAYTLNGERRVFHYDCSKGRITVGRYNLQESDELVALWARLEAERAVSGPPVYR